LFESSLAVYMLPAPSMVMACGPIPVVPRIVEDALADGLAINNDSTAITAKAQIDCFLTTRVYTQPVARK